MTDYSRDSNRLTVDYLAAKEALKEEAQRALEKSDPDQSRAILADLGLQLDAVDRKYFADKQDLYNKYIEELKATAYGKLNLFSTSSFASYTDRRKNLGLDSGGQSTSDQVTRQTYGPGKKNKESAPTYGISNAQKEYFKAVEQTGQSISTNPFARRVQKDNQARLINNLSNVSADTAATLGRVSEVPGYQPAQVYGATSLDSDPEESTNLDEGYVRRLRRRRRRDGAFGLVVWNDGSAVTQQVSSKFWKVALSDVTESDILEKLAVIYFTTQDACFTYTGQLLPAFEAVQNSGFLDQGGTVVVNSEWGPNCGVGSTFLTTDVNNTFGTSMVDLNTAVQGVLTGTLTHPPLVSPFKTHTTNLTTVFTGGTPIYTHEGQAVVAYQNISQGKVVRVGDSNMNGGHPELFDKDTDPLLDEILVSSFGTSLLAWTLGVSYEDIGDIRVD